MRFIDILNQTNMNNSIIENTRIIYLSLGKVVSYDERYIFSSDIDLLYSIYNREIDINREENTKIICISINKVFKELLNIIGIQAEIIYKPSCINKNINLFDSALVFWDEQGKKYYTNLSADIFNCKYGSQTEYFGRKRNLYVDAQDVSTISPEELKEIDSKIGYIKKDYKNMAFKLLIDEMKKTNNFKKYPIDNGYNSSSLTKDQILEYKIDFISKYINFNDSTAGINELKKFYQQIFKRSTLDRIEMNKFNAYEYYKEENGQLIILSIIEINLDNGPIYYVYSNKENRYYKIEPEELQEQIYGMEEIKGKKILKLHN